MFSCMQVRFAQFLIRDYHFRWSLILVTIFQNQKFKIHVIVDNWQICFAKSVCICTRETSVLSIKNNQNLIGVVGICFTWFWCGDSSLRLRCVLHRIPRVSGYPGSSMEGPFWHHLLHPHQPQTCQPSPTTGHTYMLTIHFTFFFVDGNYKWLGTVVPIAIMLNLLLIQIDLFFHSTK